MKGSAKKNGMLSRMEARNAVLDIKARRASSGASAPNQHAKEASTSVIERYLGHFGVGKVAAKKTAARKVASGKKNAVKKATTRNHRRAG